MHCTTDIHTNNATHHATDLRTWWEAFSDSYTMADIHFRQT